MKKKKDDDNDKKYIRPHTCRNCGINGHLYKDCIHPIMSFGIICYKRDENENIKYLMIQRKDSLCFMEFIRGKYNIIDIAYIKQLILSMTRTERSLLLNNTFDEIWNYAWNQGNLSNIKHTVEYIDSKNKYEYLKNTNILVKFMHDINIITSDQEQEWGFPKGRRKLRESDIQCAIREFCEETRLTSNDFNILNDIIPFEEIFFGTNNVLYKHLYYIAKINNINTDLSVDENCLEQIREIRAVNWFSYEEVLKHIKEHNIERHHIIKQTNKIIENIEKIPVLIVENT